MSFCKIYLNLYSSLSGKIPIVSDLIRFEKGGHTVKPLEVIGEAENTGTMVIFKADSEIFKETDVKVTKDINIKGITSDSRKVEEDYLFVAISGFEMDGHKFINSALEKGAKEAEIYASKKLLEVREKLGIKY